MPSPASPTIVDVITFDHELVDLDVLDALEAEGAVLRPEPALAALLGRQGVSTSRLQ